MLGSDDLSPTAELAADQFKSYVLYRMIMLAFFLSLDTIMYKVRYTTKLQQKDYLG